MDLANPTWWIYVALLVIAVYFRFSRFFSIRNLDLILLLSLSASLTAAVLYPRSELSEQIQQPDAGNISDESVPPGAGREALAESSSWDRRGLIRQWAPVALMLSTVLLLARLVLDERLTRRPRLDQNLTTGGIVFLCLPAFAILMSHVALRPPPQHNHQALRFGQALLDRQEVSVDPSKAGETLPAPTETLVAAGGNIVAGLARTETDWIARGLVIAAHTLVVAGLVLMGHLHFASFQLGISMACLYLLLPCTGVFVHQLSHVLPAACLIWAFVAYRHPLLSGILLGLACGTLFFSVFLLPLWAVFYGRRGGIRFVSSVVAVAAVLVSSLLMISRDASSFMDKLITTANWTVFRLLEADSAASESEISQVIIRIVMGALFFVMMTALTVLPRPRNLENLLGNSTCLIVAAQLWYPEDIGHYVMWYLPLLLLVIFRPRLDRLIPPDLPIRHRNQQFSEVGQTNTSNAV